LLADGYSAVIARTGPAGLQWLRDETFDVVVLDWMLPGCDGMEIAGKESGQDICLTCIVESYDPQFEIVSYADFCRLTGRKPKGAPIRAVSLSGDEPARLLAPAKN